MEWEKWISIIMQNFIRILQTKHLGHKIIIQLGFFIQSTFDHWFTLFTSILKIPLILEGIKPNKAQDNVIVFAHTKNSTIPRRLKGFGHLTEHNLPLNPNLSKPPYLTTLNHHPRLINDEIHRRHHKTLSQPQKLIHKRKHWIACQASIIYV